MNYPMNIKHLNILIICFFFLFVDSIFSQEKYQINIDVGYPSPDEKFFPVYKGVIAVNIGASYRLTGNLFSGITFCHLDTKQKSPDMNARYYIMSLNIKYKQKLPFHFFVLPETGAGLAFINLKSDQYNYNDTQNGINFYGKLAVGYPINKICDILIYYRYDYIHLSKDKEFTKLEYFRNLHVANFGIGINIKIKDK